jgi:multidrug efflux pump subunit AcrB
MFVLYPLYAAKIPLTLSADLWRSLGTSIIFGLLFSTVLTLFIISMLYLRFAEKRLAQV